jgi:hypothetical protein
MRRLIDSSELVEKPGTDTAPARLRPPVGEKRMERLGARGGEAPDTVQTAVFTVSRRVLSLRQIYFVTLR